MANVVGDSANQSVPAVVGKHSTNGIGVSASSEQGWAIRADAKKDTAVFATSDAGTAIDARSTANIGAAVSSEKSIAIRAIAKKDTAVFATSDAGTAIDARSTASIGVYGKGGKYAGYFEGNVVVTGDIQLPNADCAEEFDAYSIEDLEPGTVMVIESNSTLRQSTEAYDKRVAGVISGANNLKPGLVLGIQPERKHRLPIALIGKVYCKVDADSGAIQVGDLLTTSSTKGYAMKAQDPSKAFGSVIGKALSPLKEGKGKIPILVALQ